MANTFATPTWVVRKSLRVLHQKLNFIGNINRQYDDQYVVKGAKAASGHAEAARTSSPCAPAP
jgi:hypothetical protein